MLTRREATGAIVAAIGLTDPRPATAAAASIGGLRVGVCAGSYRDIPRTADHASYISSIAKACAASGAGLIEYHSTQFEPPVDRPTAAVPGAPPPLGDELRAAQAKADKSRADLRAWRLAAPLSYFETARRVFTGAGLTPFSYAFTLTDDMTDAELSYAFRSAKALGCGVISTNNTKVSMGPRLATFAERHGIDLGFHNHAAAENPNEVASIQSFETLMALSPRCKANLDIGHFTAANLDPIAFIQAHHSRITHLHFKDRKRNQGPNLPWGQGDTPLKEALQLVKRNRYPIPCLVEYEYYNAPGGEGSILENRRCLDFMRAALV